MGLINIYKIGKYSGRPDHNNAESFRIPLPYGDVEIRMNEGSTGLILTAIGPHVSVEGGSSTRNYQLYDVDSSQETIEVYLDLGYLERADLHVAPSSAEGEDNDEA